MTLTLVAIINAFLAICVLVAIVGMHTWAIWTTDADHGGPSDATRLRFARSNVVEVEVEVEEETLPAGVII